MKGRMRYVGEGVGEQETGGGPLWLACPRGEDDWGPDAVESK